MTFFPENKDSWIRIASLINDSKRIILSTHVNPDGDAIGSLMALAGFLTLLGKPVRIINESKTPDLYKFLDPQDIIESYSGNHPPGKKPEKGDLVIFLDLGQYSRAGKIADYLVNNEAAKVIIDHHQPEPVKADVLASNPQASSTGSLVYDLMCHIDCTLIDKNIARLVLTAVVTDTGYFRYSSTTATTHLIAAELYRHGANVGEIRKSMENGHALCRQKLLGYTLARVEVIESGRMAYSVITTSMFEETGALREHTEGIIDQIRIIQNIKVASLIIQEKPDRYKVSFRTKDSVSANEIATLLGGGGHLRAAGATVNGPLEKVTSQVINATRKALNTGLLNGKT